MSDHPQKTQAQTVEHFRIGDWIVYPKENALVSDSERVTIEPRAMETLEFLAYNAGSVVSPERLLVECWAGTNLGDNPVHKAIAQLRKALGDSAVAPTYIETIRKRGYRLIAPVTLPAGYRGPVAPVLRAGNQGAQGTPFRGLDAFDTSDASVFFGRDAAVATLLQALDVQWKGGSALVLLVGASGSGKSSLLNAGLIPRLMAPSAGAMRVVAIAQVPGRGPGARTLSAAVADALVSTLSPPLLEGDAIETWRDGFDTAPERTVMRLVQRIATAQRAPLEGQAPALVLVIDQLDDFFPDDVDPVEAATAVELLRLLVRSGAVAVVAACRSSAYPGLAAVPDLLALKQPTGHIDLAPPGPAEISEIIRRPAQIAALTFEEGAQGRLDDVLRDAALRQRHCLPLLQHTLQQLYERREEGGRLTFAAYNAIGGLDGALRQHAEQAIATVSPAAGQSLPDVLIRLVRHSPGSGQISCVAAPITHFSEGPERELVEALLRHRLLVGTAEDNAPSVQLTHEALLSAWPRAAEWIAENRDDLHLRERLHAVAQRWHEEGRGRDLQLPAGRLLDEAQDLLQRRAGLLDDTSRALIEASLRRQRTVRWARRAAITAVCLLAVTAATGFALAHHARLQAEQDRLRAAGMVDFMLGDLTDRLERVGRMDLLDEVANRVQRDLASAQAGRHDTRLERSKVLRQLGRIRIARGDVAAAEPMIAESLALASAVVGEQPQSAAAQLNLGETRYWIGYFAYLRGDQDAARQQWSAYRDAAELATRLTPEDPKAWVEASYALNSLGTLSRGGERLDEALDLFQQSVAHKQRAITLDDTDPRLRADLADSLSWVASTLDRMGQWRRARAAYDEAISVIAGVRTHAPQDAEWMYREAMLRTQRGQVLGSLEDEAGARADYSEAVVLLDRIGAAQPDRSDWARDRVITHRTAGELALDQRDLQAARNHFDVSDRLLGALVNAGATVQDLPRIQIRAALGLARLAGAEGATAQVDSHLAHAQALLDASPPSARIPRRERLLRAETILLRAELGVGMVSDDALYQAAEWLGSPTQRSADREATDLWRRLQPLLPGSSEQQGAVLGGGTEGRRDSGARTNEVL